MRRGPVRRVRRRLGCGRGRGLQLQLLQHMGLLPRLLTRRERATRYATTIAGSDHDRPGDASCHHPDLTALLIEKRWRGRQTRFRNSQEYHPDHDEPYWWR